MFSLVIITLNSQFSILNFQLSTEDYSISSRVCIAPLVLMFSTIFR